MKITEERFEDAGEQDEDGHYDYYYSGVVYVIHEGDFRCKARTYDHDPDKVSILMVAIGEQKMSGEAFIAELMKGASGDGAPFHQVFNALSAKGHKAFDILTNAGYVSVDSRHIDGAK
jgi:hypothetical protein